MFEPGDIISYLDMCREEEANLQRGMNFRFRGKQSVILMSLRPGAPYADRVEDDGRVLIYEGHDISKTKSRFNPKKADQPMYSPNGKLSQNGLFFQAAANYRSGKDNFERVRVYEKIRPGIWVFNGLFKLVDAWQEHSKKRQVFKFRLELMDNILAPEKTIKDLEHDRLIPTVVKLHVWKRDKGQCVQCGSKDNLHFDHIIPFSKGGSSLVVENIQLLCARHNLAKRDRIE